MPPLPLLVFVVGTGSLGAEIAAVRLLAPYFGASTIVWANTIGIVLVALSVGYWLGGRLADRHPEHARRSACSALVAAVLLAARAVRGGPDARHRRRRARRDLRRRLPRLARRRARAGGGAGAAARRRLALGDPARRCRRSRRPAPWPGRLYALSTAGSLVGTLLSALLLIPLVGTRRTFLIFALAIAVVAVLGLRPVRRYALAPAAIAALIALPGGHAQGQDRGRRPCHPRGRDGVPVRARDRVPDDGKRTLELNEGQAQHSVCRPSASRARGPATPSPCSPGDVWDGHLVLPLRGAASEPPRRVAILGNAAGTTSRAYEEFFPRHARGRRGDRLRAVRDRAPLLRHEQPAAPPLPRGRAPVPAPDRRHATT